MSNGIKRIVILGGGTAGWLAANHLASTLVGSGITITLVESKEIGTIGVGEGTVPMIRETLKRFGIRETDMFRHCNATFKQSIKFVDWLHNPEQKPGHYYHHPFEYRALPYGAMANQWLASDRNKSFVDTLTAQGAVCDAGLAPKLMTQAEYAGHFDYAFHFDARKFAELMRDNAVERFGVIHRYGKVVDARTHLNGDIESVILEQGEALEADLFIDCSGFACRLLGDVYRVPFVDKSSQLFVDTALAFQVPYTDSAQPVASSTIATAQPAGWIWDIGLQERRGIGHVYSSQYMGDEEAERILRAYAGKGSEGLEPRKIPMKIGYRQEFWRNNCVAIGLSQGFVEPLEATAILVTDTACRMLAEMVPAVDTEMPVAARRFNRVMVEAWERVIDFIQLHYRLSQRDDTAFWQDNRNNPIVSDTLQERLALWQHRTPCEFDFDSRLEVFNLASYCYVLYGMEFETQLHGRQAWGGADKPFLRHCTDVSQYTEGMLQLLKPNRALIDKVRQYGLHQI
ncbi:tryptophan 7-halogenase [Marinobacter hydrocarbonoclasticus]|nr:tryptophan 7-halogenase [Marinobacter nauticus]